MIGTRVAALWDRERVDTFAIAAALGVSEALVERELNRLLDIRWLLARRPKSE